VVAPLLVGRSIECLLWLRYLRFEPTLSVASTSFDLYIQYLLGTTRLHIGSIFDLACSVNESPCNQLLGSSPAEGVMMILGLIFLSSRAFQVSREGVSHRSYICIIMCNEYIHRYLPMYVCVCIYIYIHIYMHARHALVRLFLSFYSKNKIVWE
jgi:hypothetical protein